MLIKGFIVQKEVEIKLQVEDEAFNSLRAWLKENTEFCGVKNILDFYINNPKSSFYFDSTKGYIEVLNFLRIRITQDSDFLCYKKRHIDNNGNTTSVDEHEIIVDDGLTVLQILKFAGFCEEIKIRKEREVYLFDNKFEIVIDQVDGLGKFIEIETKIKNLEIKDIVSFLESINITRFKQFDRGYLCMFLNPDYEFGREVNL